MVVKKKTRQEKMFMLLDAVDTLKEDLALFSGASAEELEVMILKALESIDNIRTKIESLDV